MNLFYPAIILGAMGLMLGILLGVASFVFKVKEDERLPVIISALPGANCGGCGFSGCSALAHAIIEGDAKPNSCPVGGAESAEKICSVMGLENEGFDAKTAFVMCSGTTAASGHKYVYRGVSDCSMAYALGGGPKDCAFGCVGMGNCTHVCEFDAIKIINGVAVVLEQKCTACGNCAKACPVKIIDIVPKKNTVRVRCKSEDKTLLVKRYCQSGCLGCKICEKKCPANAIIVTNNYAKIDYSKCISCNACADACPKKIIAVF